jgi:hypothetical protein
MLVVKETTKWKDGTPNHVYVLSDDKRSMFAYVNGLTGKATKFGGRRTFDPRYRTFRIIKRLDEKSKNRSWKVSGSTGEVYVVEETDRGKVCSCAGFLYRGKCRHINMVGI